jgi:multidrug efflux pump
MKITEYFIKHPVSAIILNCALIMVGVLCFYNLSIREYPDVKFPVINVETIYPNASAEVVESSVTNALEDQLSGIEGLDHIKSSSVANRSSITMKFLPKISMDRALIAVKDAIGMAKADLPEQVKDPIVLRGAKNQGAPFMAACMESTSMSFSELTHYANVTLKNAFRSIQGISSVQVWGKPYTYKITLDHQKMYNFGINADEIYDSIAKAEASLPAGKFQNKVPVTIKSELKTLEDFENILVKKSPHPVYLKSLANIELAEENQKLRLKINGKPGLCMGLEKSSDDNPLEVSSLVYEKVAEIKKTLPDNIKLEITLDQAEFIRSSLKNIQSSIIESILFVLVIIFLFLRNIRATIIPVVTIPVSLIGSLLFLNICGFSINVMTLLAMVLAVGLVVDDAIVMLENITRYIEKGETPLDAAIKGSKEIAFAVIAMTLTLSSVYAPIAFVSGITGQLFIEFAAALAGSVIISGVSAITLSPLMCANILRNQENHLFPKIDAFLAKLTSDYLNLLRLTMKYNKLLLSFFIVALISIALCFNFIPKETVPSEDRSLIGVSVPGDNIDSAEANTNAIENAVKNTKEASGILTFAQEWGGQVILPLKPIEKRSRSADQIVQQLRPSLVSFPSFDAWPWSFSSGLPGLDSVEDTSELSLIISTVDSYSDLFKNINEVRRNGEEKHLFKSIYHDLRLDNMGYSIDFDTEVLAKLGIDKKQVAKAVSIFFSGTDSLKFKKDGILYPITIEGDAKPWSLDELYITNSNGKRISIASFATLTSKAEPKSLSHYNQMRSVSLKADLTSADSLEQSMQKLYKLADENLPKSYKKTWAGIAKTYSETSATMPLLFMLSMLFIYAILAVQFESFIDPLIILFTVPLACSGALVTLYATSGTLNVYSQVGLITLIGLITKHGILMVEFANQLRAQGLSIIESIEQASSMRLRPILMTTGAMVFGSIPLILSGSSGSEARHAIGIVLVSGLSLGTLFTLFVLPSVYCFFKNLKK